jgi:hypothetical protein
VPSKAALCATSFIEVTARPDERAAAERAMRETHQVFINFAAGISRAYL